MQHALLAPEIIRFERRALYAQGVLSILFGLIAMFWPGITALALVYLFGTFLLADGTLVVLFSLLAQRRKLKHPHTESRVLLGLLQVAAGLFLLLHAAVSFGLLVLLLGAALVARGIVSFMHAFREKHVAPQIQTLHAVLGALGFVVGLVILAQPAAGGLAFVWVLGLYALASGPVLLAMASRLGKQAAAHGSGSSHHRAAGH